MAQLSNTNNELKHTMKSRHLFMIALGGVIGTGLFNGSGFIIRQAGPGGSVLAFIAGGLLISLIFIPEQRLGIYCTVPFIIFCYTYYYIKIKKKTVSNTHTENKISETS